MVTLSIRHIGPLADTGVIAVKPVLLLIGKQSSGKSTFLKILCYCRWMEKRIMMEGDDLLRKYTHYGRFLNELKHFHRFDDGFFSSQSVIDYHGDCVDIRYDGGRSKNAQIIRKPNFREHLYNTKICFIPSERNLVSALKNVDRMYRSNEYDVIFNFIMEYREANDMFTKDAPLTMPFDEDVQYFFDKKSGREVIRLRGSERHFSPYYASSGVQSALPALVMAHSVFASAGRTSTFTPNLIAKSLSTLLSRKGLAEEEVAKEYVQRISKFTQYKFSQLYVEEIEQNLFPKSQYDVVGRLVELLKRASLETNRRSCLVMTTHSPYVLSALNMLMKASAAAEKDAEAACAVVPESRQLPASDFSAYYVTPTGGMVDVMDRENGFINGDFLDEVSDVVDEQAFRLNEIIYS